MYKRNESISRAISFCVLSTALTADSGITSGSLVLTC